MKTFLGVLLTIALFFFLLKLMYEMAKIQAEIEKKEIEMWKEETKERIKQGLDPIPYVSPYDDVYRIHSGGFW
jgi:Na+-transporting methylmalonyl-CoA/oxaloacetate decarboxylase gamma subunit